MGLPPPPDMGMPPDKDMMWTSDPSGEPPDDIGRPPPDKDMMWTSELRRASLELGRYAASRQQSMTS